MQHDEKFKQKLRKTVDEETLKWAQKESREFAKLMSYYKCAMLEVETRFQVLNEEYLLEHDRAPINSISSRLKTLPSIREKLERKDIPFELDAIEDQLNDIAGVRIICPFPDDVHTMANTFLRQDDIELLQKKDYISNPKTSGYRSLHLIVAIPVHLADGKRMTKVEIQIRTIAMDFWASLEHQLRYKRDNAFTPEMAAELYECAQLSAALDIRMDSLRKSVQAHNEKQIFLEGYINEVSNFLLQPEWSCGISGK